MRERLLLPVLFALFCPLIAFGQGTAAEQANAAAYDIFLQGDYEKAAEAYEEVLADYPTANIVPGAQLQLAYARLFLGDFDAARQTLQKLLAGPPPPPAINEAARSLLPQVISAKASAMEPGASGRDALFDEAVKGFTEFINAFPKSPEKETAQFGRALANFQLDNYDLAIPDLEANVQEFPRSPTISQSEHLLALAYATKGSVELAKGDGADDQAAFANYDRAIELLRKIMADKTDLTLVNEAQFQTGEILFNRAAFSEEADRPALWDEALAAYRSVLPKEELVELQKRKLANFPELRRRALQTQDTQAMQRLDRENERELKRLSALEARPDQTTAAMLKSAEIFFNRNQPDAARVLLDHLEPYLDTDEQKKRAMYFKAMSYAVQNATEQAVAAYEAFQAQHKGDSLAQNLPFAIGMALLAAPDPASAEKAITYFDESLEVYPKGRVAGLTVVNRAAALSRLGRTDEALKTFQDFLATNPSPEEGVVAQMGIADIYKNLGRWDEAITAYQNVIDTYPDEPQAKNARFWIAISTQQKGDHKAAITQINEFMEANPDHPLLPNALYGLATSQVAVGDKEAAFNTMADLAERFPQSEPATFTYFQRAEMRRTDGRTDEMAAILREFVEKYPQDNKVYFAFDLLAKTSLAAGKPDEAVESLGEFVKAYPQDPQAPVALLQIGQIQNGQAEALGRYSAMPQEDQEKWTSLIEGSTASAERVVKEYPDSPQANDALKALLKAQQLRASAGLSKPEDVRAYFEGLAADAPDNIKSKAMFTLASYVAETNPAEAVSIMEAAYNPEVRYLPMDLDAYTTALLETGKTDAASAVFEKLAADYPVPPGVQPNQAPRDVQEAQAIILFGQGRMSQEQGDTAAAGKSFEQLKSLYPWSPKVLEANFGIAQALVADGKLDEALQLLPQVIRAQTASATLRAESMLLAADILAEKGQTKDAIDNYLKISQFYSGVPKPAAAGLWKGGQLLEKEAQATTEGALKKRYTDEAVRAYKLLVADFPNSEFTPQARERLTALGQ